jgi:hypothetical protein
MTMTPILPADFFRLRPYFAGQSYPLCVYSLAALICWRNHEYYPCATEVNGSLLIGAEFTRHREYRHLILPLSPGRRHSPAELGALARTAGFPSYWFVPASYLDGWPRAEIETHFVVSADPAMSDYIYRSDDLAQLAGNRYARKRNLVRQFEREYVQPGRAALEPIAAANRDECLVFLDHWCREHDCDEAADSELACERLAAQNALADLETLAMQGLLMRIDGQVRAFGVASHLTEEMGVLHFEKADAGIKGLYQAFDRECARRLLAPRYRWINKESDMGLANLAKAKRSYYPERVEQAFRLTLR